MDKGQYMNHWHPLRFDKDFISSELQTESAYADYEGLRLKCQLLIQENSTQKQEMKLG